MNAISVPPGRARNGGAERGERRPVNLRGHVARGDGSTANLTVLDMSYEGCRIDCTAELQPGEAIKLAVLRRGAIEAVVRWVDGNTAGLVFESEPEPQPERELLPRRNERVVLDAEVMMRRPGKHHYRVRVFDLSPDGCKAEFVERPEHHEQIMIKFDGLEALPAQVVWLDRATGGFRFNRPIHAAVYDLLLQRLA